jgi:hypothetical protein
MSLSSLGRNIDEIEEIDFLELLPETLETDLAKARELDKYDEALEDHLHNTHATSDNESYDCHSLMLSVLNREFNIDVTCAPEFEKPNIEDFKWNTDWQNELVERIRAMFKTPEGQKYRQFLYKLTEEIYKNSDHITLPNVTVTDDASCEDGDRKAQQIIERIFDSMEGNPKSRVILISNGKGDQFYDAHSTTILGPVPGEKDFYVLEKGNIGDPIMIQRLSEIIKMYIFSFMFMDLEVNLCNQPIDRLCADINEL